MPSSALESPFMLQLQGWNESLPIASLQGREALSSPYQFDLMGLTPLPLSVDELPAQGLAVSLQLGRSVEDESPRIIQGIVSSARLESSAYQQGGSWLALRLEPRLAKLAYRRTRRIFQDCSAQQVLSKLLQEHGIKHRWNCDEAAPTLAYCVQYDESDLEFFQRLLHRWGLFYYFEHGRGFPGQPEAEETVVLGDLPAHYAALPSQRGRGPRVLKLCDREGTWRAGAAILGFSFERRSRPTASRLRDYDYQNPALLCEDQAYVSDDPCLGSHLLREDEFHYTTGQDSHRVRNRDPWIALGHHRHDAWHGDGKSDCVDFSPGYRFTLDNHEASQLNVDWTLARVRHEARVPWLDRGPKTAVPGPVYLNHFDCFPASLPPRSARKYPVPRAITETATVVGPAHEELYVDPMGRIRVQFHWDRDGARDAHSTCWLRPAQSWAGAGFGQQFLPRVGTEVLVGFLQGDPDHPVVLGSLYNGAQAPPFALPEQRNRSGFRSRSTPGGQGFNELSFDDTLGAEELCLRAERDLVELVRHDHHSTVQGSRALRIHGHHTSTIGASCTQSIGLDHRLTCKGGFVHRVGEGYTLHITGDAHERVSGSRSFQSAETFSVQSTHAHFELRERLVQKVGSLSLLTSAEGGGDCTQIAHGAWTVHSHTGISLTAQEGLRLACGQAGIELGPELLKLWCGASSITLSTDELRALASTLVALQSREKLRLDGGSCSTTLADDFTVGSADFQVVGSSVSLQSSGATVHLEGDLALQAGSIRLLSGSGATQQNNDDNKRDTSESQDLTIRAQLLGSEGKVWSHTKYQVILDGKPYPVAQTDGEGRLEQVLPSGGQEGFLRVWLQDKAPPLELPLSVKPFEHTDAVSGLKARLANLGYYHGPIDAHPDGAFRAALATFQQAHELSPTALPDDATRARIRREHGE